MSELLDQLLQEATPTTIVPEAPSTSGPAPSAVSPTLQSLLNEVGAPAEKPSLGGEVLRNIKGGAIGLKGLVTEALPSVAAKSLQQYLGVAQDVAGAGGRLAEAITGQEGAAAPHPMVERLSANLDDFAAKKAADYLVTQKRLEEPDVKPVIGSMRDIHSFNDALYYTAALLGQNIPNIATTLAGGGLSTLIGEGVAKGILTNVAGNELKQLLAGYATTGVLATSAAIGTGQVGGEQIETQGEVTHPQLAAAAGLGIGALDALTPTLLIAKLGLTPGPLTTKFADLLFGNLQKTGLLGRIARAAIGDAAAEGVTEELQEEIAIAARNVYDQSYGFFGNDQTARRIENLAGGAVVGGVMGAVLGSGHHVPSTPLNPEDVKKDASAAIAAAAQGDEAALAAAREDTGELGQRLGPQVLPEDLAAVEAKIREYEQLVAERKGEPAPMGPIRTPSEQTATAAETLQPAGIARLETRRVTYKDGDFTPLTPTEVQTVNGPETRNLPPYYNPNEHAPGTVQVIGFENNREIVAPLVNQLETWIKEIAPNFRIVLGDGAFAPFSGAMGHAYVRVDENLGVIEINPKEYNFTQLADVTNQKYQARRDRAAMLYTLAHEFGHAVVDTVYQQASAEAKLDVLRGYRQWLTKIAQDKSYGNVAPQLSDYTGMLHTQDKVAAKGMSTAELLKWDPSTTAWFNSQTTFVEYLADQTAHYLLGTRQETLTPTERTFYSNIKRVLQRVYEVLKQSLPNETFAQFVDNLTLRGRFNEKINNTTRQVGRVAPFTTHAVNTATPFADNVTAAYYSPWLYMQSRPVEAGGKFAFPKATFLQPQQLGKSLIELAIDATKAVGTYDALHQVFNVANYDARAIQQMKQFVAGIRVEKATLTPEAQTSLINTWQKRGFELIPHATEIRMVNRNLSDPRAVAMVAQGATDFTSNIVNQVTQSMPLTAHDASPAPAEAARQMRLAQTDLDRFNKALRTFASILQVLRINRHIPGVPRYTEALYAWNATRLKFITLADDHLRAWGKLGKEQADALGRFLIKMNELDKWPSPQDLVTLAQQHGLSQEAFHVYQTLRDDFRMVLDTVEGVMLNEATRSIADPNTRAQRVAQIRKDFTNMRSAPYFPLSRFGNYTIAVRALGPIVHEGRSFKVGDVIRFETFDTERDRDGRLSALRNQFPDHTVSAGYIPEEIRRTFQGLPPMFLEMLRDKLDTSSMSVRQKEEFKKALDELAFLTLPGKSFRHHFRKREGTLGYSMDAQRSYANYFFHAANHLARIKHAHDFDEALNTMRTDIKTREATLSGDTTTRTQLYEHLLRHEKYIMEPQNEWSAVRAMAFHWYLGLSVKSALVNLTQVPIATYSHLAAIYGDASAIKHIVSAMRHLRVNLHNLNIANPTVLDKARAMAHQQGFLDESQATELAAISEGSNLQRTISGTALQRFMRNMSFYSSWTFQQAEKFNRSITFDAAFNLALQDPTNERLQQIGKTFTTEIRSLNRDLGFTREEAIAFIHAREVVEVTQGEYARFNRPEIMRGKKGVIFLFKQFTQHMLWLAKNEPGGKRYLMIMLGLAGLSGMPFAEDAMAIAKWLARLLGHNLDLNVEIRKFVHELGVNPDLVMHGISREGMGIPALAELIGIPFPNVDLSGSLSMGRVIPGAGALPELLAPGGDFNAGVEQLSQEAGGAGVGAVLAMMRAISDSNPNTLKRWERAMPAFFRNLSRAYRYATQGAETTSTGQPVAKFDITDPQQLAEVVGQGLGFTPARVGQAWEEFIAQRNAQHYWMTQRGMLFDQYDYARRTHDREAMADVRQAIRSYNQDTPSYMLRVSPKDLGQSYMQRERVMRKLSRGQAPQRRYTPIYRDIRQNAFPPDGLDQASEE